MPEKITATVATEKNAEGGFNWIVTAVEGDIGTMPRRERSTQSFPSEAEALRAGEKRVEEMRVD